MLLVREVIIISIKEYGFHVIGAVVYEFVFWVLKDCEKVGAKTIYFLARDGYLMKKVAEIICKKNNIDIECKYLYCSRMALRSATYAFIGEEAFELLFKPSLKLNLRMLLQRLQLDKDQLERILFEIDEEDLEQVLNQEKLDEIKSKLCKSDGFKKALRDLSLKNIENVVGYFKQEGLLEEDSIYIVDSGWSGSMQRSLRQILDTINYDGKITGYYFGLYNAPRSKKDGVYKSFYFNHKGNILRKSLFDNKLFEVFLPAPHGMCVGYNKIMGVYEPVFSNDYVDSFYDNYKEQIIYGAIDYALVKHKSNQYYKRESANFVQKILIRAMCSPTAEEVGFFGKIHFSDDITDLNKICIVDQLDLRRLGNNMFFYKIYGKYINTKYLKSDSLVWPYGTASKVSGIKKYWYRLNIFMYEYLKYLRLSIKQNKLKRGYDGKK